MLILSRRRLEEQVVLENGWLIRYKYMYMYMYFENVPKISKGQVTGNVLTCCVNLLCCTYTCIYIVFMKLPLCFSKILHSSVSKSGKKFNATQYSLNSPKPTVPVCTTRLNQHQTMWEDITTESIVEDLSFKCQQTCHGKLMHSSCTATSGFSFVNLWAHTCARGTFLIINFSWRISYIGHS